MEIEPEFKKLRLQLDEKIKLLDKLKDQEVFEPCIFDPEQFQKMTSLIQTTDFSDSNNHKAVIDVLLEQLKTVNLVISKQDRTIEKQGDAIT